MREGVVVALVIGAVLTAGCMGVFGGSEEGTVFTELTTNNSTGESYVFEVYLLNDPTDITIVEDDGSTASEQSHGGLLVDQRDDGYLDVQPQSGQHYGNFTLNGSQSVEREIEIGSGIDTIFVVVHDEQSGLIIGYVSANCLSGAPHSFTAVVDTYSLTGYYGC